MAVLNIANVVGCRPDFVKMASLIAEMNRHADMRPFLIHTGHQMESAASDVFFRDLELPEPDVYLEVGSGSHARRTALIIQSFESVLFDLKPDLVLVIGDVDSTLACMVAAVKLGFPVAHVEAGLRSHDRETPEEINRVLTDTVSDLLFASERAAVKNLQREGIRRHRIFYVGNVLIDTLRANAARIARSDILERVSLAAGSYCLFALHRPCNIDDAGVLGSIAAAVERLQAHQSIVFSVHPAALSRMRTARVWQRLRALPNFRLVDPLGYIDFMKLLRESRFVMTDSGGVQEEATALGIPCLTLRETTERSATLTHGTNRLVGTRAEKILAESMQIINGNFSHGRIPEKWDGLASRRLVDVLRRKEAEIKQLHRSVRRRAICPDTYSAA